MAETEKIGYVKGLGEIYRSYANFAQQIKDFNKQGIKSPVSIRDASFIRLYGNNQESTRTCHAPICAKDSPTIVVRMSPLIKNLEMAEQAVNAHGNNKYAAFDNDKSIYAKWEKIAKNDESKMPEKRRAIILPKREDYRIHRDSDEARFFWQGIRVLYFNKFVSSDSVPCWQIPADNVDSANGTIINYLWFDWPGGGSGLGFWGGLLVSADRAFGVLRKSAEGTSQNSGTKVKSYTSRQAMQYLQIIEDVMSGKSGTSKLEKIAEFFKQE